MKTNQKTLKTLSAADLKSVSGGLMSAFNQAETLSSNVKAPSRSLGFCDDMTIAE